MKVQQIVLKQPASFGALNGVRTLGAGTANVRNIEELEVNYQEQTATATKGGIKYVIPFNSIECIIE